MGVSQAACPLHSVLSFPPAPSAQSRAREATMTSLPCQRVRLTAQRRPATPPTQARPPGPRRDSAGSRRPSRAVGFQLMFVTGCVFAEVEADSFDCCCQSRGKGVFSRTPAHPRAGVTTRQSSATSQTACLGGTGGTVCVLRARSWRRGCTRPRPFSEDTLPQTLNSGRRWKKCSILDLSEKER